MKCKFETIYFFFAIKNDVFREEIQAAKCKDGYYTVRADKGSAYELYCCSRSPLHEDLMDVVQYSTSLFGTMFPMFSRNPDENVYIQKLKECKQLQITKMQEQLQKMKTENESKICF